jgi:hypothetical protein
MSEVFIAWEPAPADTVFAQGAFDGQVGSTIRVKLPRGREADGVIRSVTVADDGGGAEFIVEVPDGTLPKQPLSGYSIGGP